MDSAAGSPWPPPPAVVQSSRQSFAARRFRYRNEPTRARDVLRYLRTWEDMYKPAQLHHNPFAHGESHPAPTACPDTALSAFSQLAAIRVHTRRCLITLTCATTEWVLADCGPQTALQGTSYTRDATDGPWIGTCSFPRAGYINHRALNEWRNARRARDVPADYDHYYTGGLTEHAFIIEDLRHDKDHEGLESIRHHAPWIRFYCAVPLRDANGSVLGSLTLLDDKPRFGVSLPELTLLEDLSDTIVEHLSATLVRARRQRGERLIASLGLFHAGEESLREWWLAQDDARVLNTGRNVDKGTASDRQGRVDAEFGLHPHSGSRDPDSETVVFDHESQSDYFGTRSTPARNHASTAQLSSNSVEEETDTQDRRRGSSSSDTKHSTGEKQEPGSAFDLARATAITYERASNLLREALGADGVAFIDAGHVTVPSRAPVRTAKERESASKDGVEHSAKSSSDTDSSDSNVERTQLCKLLGISARNSSPSDQQAQVKRFNVPERYLQRLIKRCPEGLICQFDQHGQAYSSSDESSSKSSSEELTSARPKKRSEYQRLGKIFGGAKVVSVYPMWDNGYSRWRSCAFAWNITEGHCLDQREDLMFLRSFGNSILAELSRLESIAADMSKATFISSISHELRSPLHGILAGAEFLLDTELTDFQLEMTHAVGMAGRTLLDTVDHVLDYSKIRGLTKERKNMQETNWMTNPGHENPDKLNAVLPTDLARLTEEVVETIVTANRLHNSGVQVASKNKSASPSAYAAARSSSSASLASPSVSISLNIAYRQNWTIATQPGGWTRIITNLVGNAVKYTSDGHISIRLSFGEPLKTGPQGARRCPVLLSVEDSGIGMSDTFLAHGLFTPFRQENPFADGTGLGLSIVKQIVRSMGAELDISSQLGKGTTAQVRFLAHFLPDNAADDVAFDVDGLSESMAIPRIDELHLIRSPSAPVSQPDSTLSSSVAETIREWFACEVVEGNSIAKSDGTSICGIMERDLIEWQREQPKVLADVLEEVASNYSRIFVFGQTMRSVVLSLDEETLPVTPVFIHQPLGPRKLLRAIGGDRQSSPNRDQSDERRSLPSRVDTRNNSKTSLRFPADTVLNHDDTRRQSSSQQPLKRPAQPGRTRSSILKGMSNKAKSELSTDSASRIESDDTTLTSTTTQDVSLVSKEQEVQGERNTILLVEDNDVNMKLLIALASKLKVPYRCANNGLEAVHIYTCSPSQFFLILMDMSMPVMDGFVATSKIRQEESKRKLKRAFIMALTGVTDAAERRRAFESGIDEFHSKPVRMKELKGFIDSARQKQPELS